MQSFVTDPKENPYNVVEPGKRPRVTLTPTLALKDGKPFLSFAVQGGDTQDQNLLQFFLNVVEFGMTVQEATEAPNINTDQLWLSLGGEDRKPKYGNMLLHASKSCYSTNNIYETLVNRLFLIKSMEEKFLRAGEIRKGPVSRPFDVSFRLD